MISFKSLCLKAALLSLNFLAFSAQAWAESVSVSPTNLVVPSGARQTILTVKAAGASQSVVQIRAFRWNPNSPPNELFDQTNVVASPPISRLKAGQELTVRPVRTASVPVQEQECYRVIVDRIPNSPEDSKSITLRVRHSVPLCFLD